MTTNRTNTEDGEHDADQRLILNGRKTPTGRVQGRHGNTTDVESRFFEPHHTDKYN